MYIGTKKYFIIVREKKINKNKVEVKESTEKVTVTSKWLNYKEF